MVHKNCIFDLYGTLIHVHTDEEQPMLWQKMRDIYACYGADYSGQELKEMYHRICRDEQSKIGQKTGYTDVEIDLGQVFWRILKEAPYTHPVSKKITARQEWTYGIANTFRCLSRDVIRPYPNTIPVLEALKALDYRLYLLSNAQAVFTVPEMEMCGLSGYFDAVYLSSDHRVRKPDQAFLQKMMEEQDLKKADTILIGNDFSTDIRIAMEAGIDSIFLNTDHYSQPEMERRFSEIRMNQDYAPRIISSGDIGEILILRG